MILKVFASALTGIGGHYLNRRWDKAILFLCLFVLYWAAAYAFFIFALQSISSSPKDMAQEFNNVTQLLSKVSSIGIFILWVVSLIVTFLDSNNKVEPNFIKWTMESILCIMAAKRNLEGIATTATHIYKKQDTLLTPTLQKPEGFRVKASEGEVVVFYFEPSATQNLKSSGFPEG